MMCLIDADVLLHEIGWSSQFKDKETGEEILLPMETVAKLLDDKINLIEHECFATEPSTLFISPSPAIVRAWNRWAKYNEEQPIEFVPNFRYELATSKPYKGTRKNPKPFHFYNILTHMLDNYHVVISEEGLEADDEMSIAQLSANDVGIKTVICSRDKDLRICPGLHYSWECGKQEAIGPVRTDKDGWLEKRVKSTKVKAMADGTEKVTEEYDVLGYGLAFFCYQLLAGDAADNIPGLPGIGKVAAWNALEGIEVKDMKKVVKDLYKEKLGEASKDYFLEQAGLLWIRQDKNKPFNLRNF